MTVVSVNTYPEELKLVIVAEFGSSPERVWRLWEDPRLLERWWGPPTFPATFSRHDFVVDGESRYHMTGPNGETPRGWWRIKLLERPHRLEFDNGLAGEDGEPAPGVEPMPSSVTFESITGGTRMTAVSAFVDEQQMQVMLDMGMAEGMRQAIAQIDNILA